jgi:hypothetical protein
VADILEQTHRDLLSLLRTNIVDVQTPARADWIRVKAPFVALDYLPASTSTQSSSGTAITTAAGSTTTTTYTSIPSPTTAAYPIISVVLRRNIQDKDFATVGEAVNPGKKSNWFTMEYQVDIWVQRGDSFLVGAQTMSDMLLLTYLEDQVNGTVAEKGRSAIGSFQWVDIVVSGHQEHEFDEVHQLFRRTVLVEILRPRTKVG